MILRHQDVQSKVSDAVLGKEKPVDETDPDYEKLKHYVVELEDHLAEAQRQAMKLVKRQRGAPLSFLFVMLGKIWLLCKSRVKYDSQTLQCWLTSLLNLPVLTVRCRRLGQRILSISEYVLLLSCFWDPVNQWREFAARQCHS